MEAVVLQAVPGQPLGRRCCARAAERTRCAEADVVEENYEHVWRVVRGPKWLDRRERRLGILGVQRELPLVWPVGDRQDVT
jgi:hypothetical protein